jgi:hypothetical protein
MSSGKKSLNSSRNSNFMILSQTGSHIPEGMPQNNGR